MQRNYIQWAGAAWCAGMFAIPFTVHGAHPDPADPTVAVPEMKLESPFNRYISAEDGPLVDWTRQSTLAAGSNDHGAHGGHMAVPSNPAKLETTPPQSTLTNNPDSMAREAAKAAKEPPAPVDNAIRGTGIIQQIDKANNKVKIAHDPIEKLRWPKMIMFMRLKDSSLAQQIKEGDKVDFSLEKSNAGYVISGFDKPGGAQSPYTKP